jgi:hypothetical protein
VAFAAETARGAEPPPSTLTEPTTPARATATPPATNGAPAAERSFTGAPSAAELELRNRLLRVYVHEHVRRANLAEGFGYANAALGALGLVVGVTAWHADRGLAAAWTAGFGASTLAFGASLAASRDTRVDVLTVLMPFNAGVAGLGSAVADDPGVLPRLSSASFSGAFFLLAVFDTVNAFAQRTNLSTLRGERDRLDTGDVSASELHTTEHDFLGTDVPFGSGLRAAPLGVGGVIAFVPVFGGNYTKEQQTWAAVTGSLLGVDCILTLLTRNLVPSYKDSANAAGLSLMASPGNLGFRYRF